MHQSTLVLLLLLVLLNTKRTTGTLLYGTFPFTSKPSRLDQINITGRKEPPRGPTEQRNATTDNPSGIFIRRQEDKVGLKNAPPGFSQFASFVLAVLHFNERNPIVVPELEDSFYAKQCNITFDIDQLVITDTESSASTAVSSLLKQVYNQKVPSVVIGGSDEITVLDLSVVTSGFHIPFVAFGGFSQRVVTPFYYPYSTRTSAEISLLVGRVSTYLRFKGRTNYWGLFYAISDTGTQLKDKFALMAWELGVSLQTGSYIPNAYGVNESEILGSLGMLKQSGYRTIILVVDNPRDELPLVARAAEQLEMTDGNHFWVIVGPFDMNFYDKEMLLQDTATIKLLTGAAVVREADGFMFDRKDRFLGSWQRQNATLAQLLNDMNPVHPKHDEYIYAEDDYFQAFMPSFGASFVYDAVIAAGIGMCRSSSNDSMTVVEHIHRSSFRGASGFVDFGSNKKIPGSRSGFSLSFGAFSLLPPNSTSAYTLTEILVGTDRRIFNQTWTSVFPFHYADGTTSPPLPLRDLPEQNFLTPAVRYIGLILFGVAVFLVLAVVVWIAIYNKHTVVRAAQPIFLFMMAFGSFLISCAIVTNSFDERSGWSSDQLAITCTITPWLIFVGHIVNYSALFTKLWRVNKVLQFRRARVKIQHVVWPMAVLVVSAVALLTIWTVLEGFRWDRIEVDSRTGESIGKCAGDHTKYYFTPIFLLTVAPTLMTLVMAIKTRDVEEAYSESNWIFVLVLIQIQVLLVSIPVLNILETESTIGRYLGQVMIFWTFSVSPIALIILPKIFAVYQRKKQGTRGGPSGGTRVTGLRNSSSPLISSTVRQIVLTSENLNEGRTGRNGDSFCASTRISEEEPPSGSFKDETAQP